jgi:hypothetical protein
MDDNADSYLSFRRLAALIFLVLLSLIMIASRLGWGSPAPGPTPAATSPATPAPQPTRSALPRHRLAVLSPCGRPNHIGAYRPDDAACHPSSVWTMAAFAAQLTELKTLSETEHLDAPANPVDMHCPFVILNTGNLFRGRVCFSDEGSVYRVSDGGEAEWRWGLTAEGWVLERPIIVASTN